MKFTAMLKKFLQTRRGSMTIAGALCLAPIIAMSFASVQLTQRMGQQTRLHQAETSAVLALAKEGEDASPADRHSLAQAYLEQNLRALKASDENSFAFSIAAVDDEESLTTSLAATPLVENLLGGMFDAPVKESEPVKSERYYRPIEVAVVMDASSSMLGQRDMLVEMAEKVTRTLYRNRDSADDVWLSLIAYSRFVNIGHEYAEKLITPESRMLYMPNPSETLPAKPTAPTTLKAADYRTTGIYGTIGGITYVASPSTSPIYYTKNPKYIEDLAAYNVLKAAYDDLNAEYNRINSASAAYLKALQRQSTLQEYNYGLPLDLLGPEGPGTGSVDMVCPSRKPMRGVTATASAIRRYVEDIEIPPALPSEGFLMLIGDGRYYQENLNLTMYQPADFLSYGPMVLAGALGGTPPSTDIDFVDLVKMPKHYIVSSERYDLAKAATWGFSQDEVVTVPFDCPIMPMLVGSTDQQQILDTIKKFQGIWTTGGDEGIAWAMRALSPAWREIWEKDDSYPAEYHGDTEKRILYLAGSLTSGYVGNSVNSPNAHGEMCEKLKENGVDLFIVRNNESINATSQAIYAGCVTTPDRNYQAASNSDIPAVMARMAQRQYHVRLSQ
jgi:Flp pilus assembly protein TadG